MFYDACTFIHTLITELHTPYLKTNASEDALDIYETTAFRNSISSSNLLGELPGIST